MIKYLPLVKKIEDLPLNADIDDKILVLFEKTVYNYTGTEWVKYKDLLSTCKKFVSINEEPL